MYGGCHAGAMKRIIDRYALGEHQVDMLVNFEMINTKEPFPYERLPQYDLLIFNPILNRGDWNTVHLEAECDRVGLRYLKYPWLQWGGYWPEPRTRYWGEKRSEWGVPMLLPLGAEHAARGAKAGFDSFYEALYEPRSFERVMPEWVEATTRRLKQIETQGAVDLPISDYVLDNFRREQLFLTPNHPNTPLYKFLFRGIERACGLKLDPAFYAVDRPVQEGTRLPVLPGVAELLGLGFRSSEWAHHSVVGGQYFTLREWAHTHYEALPTVIATATTDTWLKNQPSIEGAIRIRARRNSRHLLVQDDSASSPGYVAGRLFGAELPAGCQYLFRPHWTFDRAQFR